ncbi:MAG TPA: hypothetical protein VMH77_02235 [Steroidobacteraceae bacterium]|nr:hypothetical protein [Steroidobacteraceae bacterium]
MNRTTLKVMLGAAALLGVALTPMLATRTEAAQAAPAAMPGGLDRAALLQLADNYLAALVAHDPGRVPLAADIRIVENVKRIKPGEGMWKTASSGPTDFRIFAADPVSQGVGGIVVMGNEGKPVQFGFRLKVANGRIIEAEHMVVALRDPGIATLQKARPQFAIEIPYEYADSRGRMLHMAKSYYDALDNNNGHLAPFAPDCERHENGMRTAPNGGPSLTPFRLPTPAGAAPAAGPPAPPPATLMGLQDCTAQMDSGAFQYINTIDDRRVEIADTVTGVTIGFSHFHHPMTQKKFRILNNPNRDESDMSNQKPFDMPAMHMCKIWGGQIHEIEAIGISVPLDSPTGWE